MAVISGADSAANPSLVLRLRNNIIDLLPNQFYTFGGTNPLIGTNNLWYGAGPPPPNSPMVNLAANLSSDPLFVDLAKANFHLQPQSLARNAGVDTGVLTDLDGA